MLEGVTIQAVAAEGKALVRVEDMVVFVPFAVPGDVVDLQLTKKARMIILGDWITQFSYVVYDGEHLLMSQYIEGESQP